MAKNEKTLEEREELKRRAQENLSEARRLLDEAVEFAKEGGFELSFMGGTAGRAVGNSDDFEAYVYAADPERWWIPSNC